MAQPIRLMLAYRQVKYNDYHYIVADDFSRSDWTERKKTFGLDFPNLPYWIEPESKQSGSSSSGSGDGTNASADTAGDNNKGSSTIAASVGDDGGARVGAESALKLTESNAIIRHIARTYDLDGKTNNERAKLDMLCCKMYDLRNRIVRLAYGKADSYLEYLPAFAQYVRTSIHTLDMYEFIINFHSNRR